MRRFVLPASLLAILLSAGALAALRSPEGALSARAFAGALSERPAARESRIDSDSGTDPIGASAAAVSERAMSASASAPPADADGWQALGRAESARGQHAQAVVAFRNAARLRPDDARLLSEYAFSAAVTSTRTAADDPEQLIERALQIDPTSPQALTLAGSLALDRGDFEAAAQAWERLARLEPPDSPMRRDVEASAAQARRLAAAHPAAQGATYAAPLPTEAPARVTLARAEAAPGRP